MGNPASTRKLTPAIRIGLSAAAALWALPVAAQNADDWFLIELKYLELDPGAVYVGISKPKNAQDAIEFQVVTFYDRPRAKTEAMPAYDRTVVTNILSCKDKTITPTNLSLQKDGIQVFNQVQPNAPKPINPNSPAEFAMNWGCNKIAGPNLGTIARTALVATVPDQIRHVSFAENAFDYGTWHQFVTYGDAPNRTVLLANSSDLMKPTPTTRSLTVLFEAETPDPTEAMQSYINRVTLDCVAKTGTVNFTSGINGSGVSVAVGFVNNPMTALPPTLLEAACTGIWPKERAVGGKGVRGLRKILFAN